MKAFLPPTVRHGCFVLPWRTLLLTAAALALYLWAGAAPEAWVYDRHAIAQGEWWRLFTGHWVHSDPEHALWDIGALLVLGLLFESRLRWNLFPVLLLTSLGVDLWLCYAQPSIVYYCGLSGILNGLLALGLVRWWRDQPHPLVWLTGVGAVLKIVWETVAGTALLTATAWPSVPEVHGVGFVCGLLLAMITHRVDGCPFQVQEIGGAGPRPTHDLTVGWGPAPPNVSAEVWVLCAMIRLQLRARSRRIRPAAINLSQNPAK